MGFQIVIRIKPKPLEPHTTTLPFFFVNSIVTCSRDGDVLGGGLSLLFFYLGFVLFYTLSAHIILPAKIK